MNNLLKNKTLVIVGVVVIVLAAIFGGSVLLKGDNKQEETNLIPTPTETAVEMLPADALEVTLEPGSKPLYVLTIDTIPEGVKELSYEITYNSTNKGSQGIVGSPVQLAGKTTYTNSKIVFGSESRGKYSLDQGVSNIQITIRLTYDDGSEKGWKGSLEI